MLAAALFIAGIACFALHTWAEINCTRLDVETGRRDPGALVDDYGSNRGWYWRYKLPSLAGFIGGLLLLFWAIGAATIPAQGRDLDGRHAASPLKPWFDSLKSGKGPCCSDADGWALSDMQRSSCFGTARSKAQNLVLVMPLPTFPNAPLYL